MLFIYMCEEKNRVPRILYMQVLMEKLDKSIMKASLKYLKSKNSVAESTARIGIAQALKILHSRYNVPYPDNLPNNTRKAYIHYKTIRNRIKPVRMKKSNLKNVYYIRGHGSCQKNQTYFTIPDGKEVIFTVRPNTCEYKPCTNHLENKWFKSNTNLNTYLRGNHRNIIANYGNRLHKSGNAIENQYLWLNGVFKLPLSNKVNHINREMYLSNLLNKGPPGVYIVTACRKRS